uniref:Sirtuin 7 n=1 Tax=Sus scrofa TaxID=9823 RepID=A0A8D1K5V0_PIG
MAAGGLSRSERKAAERVRRLREEQQRERLRQVSRILRKAAAERSAEEGRLLAESEDLVTELQGRSRRREGLKRRQEEVCDDPEELRRKVRELADAVRNAKHLVVYTGAGISTVGRRGGDSRAPGRLPVLGKRGPAGRGRSEGAPFWVSDPSTEHGTAKQQHGFTKHSP